MGTEPESKPRLCVDCKYCTRVSAYYMCSALATRSLITGEVLSSECSTMRHGGKCGVDGSLWAPLLDADKEPF